MDVALGESGSTENRLPNFSRSLSASLKESAGQYVRTLASAVHIQNRVHERSAVSPRDRAEGNTFPPTG